MCKVIGETKQLPAEISELELAKWEISRLRITNSFLGHALQ